MRNLKALLPSQEETKRTHNTPAAELQNDNFGMIAFSLYRRSI